MKWEVQGEMIQEKNREKSEEGDAKKILNPRFRVQMNMTLTYP